MSRWTILALGCGPWGVAAFVWIPGSLLLAQLHSWQGPVTAAHQLMMTPWWNDTCLIKPHESPAVASVMSSMFLPAYMSGASDVAGSAVSVGNHAHTHLTGPTMVKTNATRSPSQQIVAT